MLAAGLVTLIVLAFLADDGNEAAAPTTAPLATTTTVPRGFPPAPEQSVCRTLLTTEEAEALVGRPLRHPVIEPTPAQCAWPVEQGTPLDAELFFVVKEREGDDLADALGRDWPEDDFRLEPADGLGEQARFVIRRADPGAGVPEEFVEGLDVFVRDIHLVLGNGGRDIWDGGTEDVKARLRLAMALVLERVEELLGTVPTPP